MTVPWKPYCRRRRGRCWYISRSRWKLIRFASSSHLEGMNENPMRLGADGTDRLAQCRRRPSAAWPTDRPTVSGRKTDRHALARWRFWTVTSTTWIASGRHTDDDYSVDGQDDDDDDDDETVRCCGPNDERTNERASEREMTSNLSVFLLLSKHIHIERREFCIS
jgi:hypothetical protein